MGFFGKLFGGGKDTTSDKGTIALDAMIEMLAAGRQAEALAVAERQVDAAREGSGATSGAYGAALFDLAHILLGCELFPRAVTVLREASDVRGTTREDEGKRLTYLMNLGDVLGQCEELEEALAVREESLAGREAFYGTEHPGYAYGLDGWAEIAIALGRYEEAEQKLLAALSIYQANGHDRYTHALAMLLVAAHGAGHQINLWLNAEAAAQVVDHLRKHSSPVAPQLELGALLTVAPQVEDKELLMQAFAALQVRAARASEHAVAIKALEQLRTLAEAEGDALVALDAELGIGLGNDKIGNHEEAARCYATVEEHARALGSAEPATLAKALRNAGLYFAGREEHRARGRKLLQEAAAIAGGGAERARAAIALGINLQHSGELAEAKTWLADGLSTLESAHPDAICGRSHLKAASEHGECGCGKPRDEINAEIERLIRAHLAPSLHEVIDSISIDENHKVDLVVLRDLEATEQRQLADAVQLGLADLKSRIREVYG
jgi:tetratricopeptide (TPR) repeat protein